MKTKQKDKQIANLKDIHIEFLNLFTLLALLNDEEKISNTHSISSLKDQQPLAKPPPSTSSPHLLQISPNGSIFITHTHDIDGVKQTIVEL